MSCYCIVEEAVVGIVEVVGCNWEVDSNIVVEVEDCKELDNLGRKFEAVDHNLAVDMVVDNCNLMYK